MGVESCAPLARSFVGGFLATADPAGRIVGLGVVVIGVLEKVRVDLDPEIEVSVSFDLATGRAMVAGASLVGRGKVDRPPLTAVATGEDTPGS